MNSKKNGSCQNGFLITWKKTDEFLNTRYGTLRCLPNWDEILLNFHWPPMSLVRHVLFSMGVTFLLRKID